MDFLGFVGSILLFIGWIWTVVEAFRTSGALWGILNIIPFQPIMGIVSGALKKISWTPVLLMIIGMLMSVLGGGLLAFSR
ncbi:MAG TPA: hypothetical protein PKY82_07195 [Pyrinomonadaceae bacterium]|nr:hypothetical protein [Pyrinomonadaceae bacterium]